MEIKMNEITSNDILISVIIPLYNREGFIGECLDSILSQTIKNIEVIVVDDGSVDSSYNLVLNYAAHDSRVRVYRIPHSGSPSKPMNIGMELAKGKYLTFVDSDDKLVFNALELFYEKAERLNAEITFSRPLIFNEDGFLCALYQDAIKNDNIALSIKDRREALFFQCVCGVLFQTSFLKKTKLQFNPDLTHAEDQLFIVAAQFCAEKIACMKEWVYLYRKGHDKNSLSANWNIKSLESILIVLKEIEKLFFSKAKFIFEDYREILLELKLIRLEHLENEIGDREFYQSIIKSVELFLPDDDQIILNLLIDAYQPFFNDRDRKDKYYKLFLQFQYRRHCSLKDCNTAYSKTIL